MLWNDYLSHNPVNPHWANRDRFVLSNGHGSMLQYSLLHLSGYDVSIDDLKNFRQLHSKTPGHPEYGYTPPGIETTTGPLGGQGIANAVGFALAEKALAAQFNRPGHDIVDHYTYAFLGDGCLMEGISHEVASLAGTLGLGKLVFFYDDNGISIDGEVEAGSPTTRPSVSSPTAGRLSPPMLMVTIPMPSVRPLKLPVLTPHSPPLFAARPLSASVPPPTSRARKSVTVPPRLVTMKSL